jgi:hypothetical protein
MVSISYRIHNNNATCIFHENINENGIIISDSGLYDGATCARTGTGAYVTLNSQRSHKTGVKKQGKRLKPTLNQKIPPEVSGEEFFLFKKKKRS